MRNETLLSVIVPIYNTEHYLTDCLNSLINQEIANYEIICINDGSTDNSLKILNKYSSNYSNIKVITQENKGQSSARNVGLKHATGKYVYFMDSDDLLEGGSLCYIMNQMEQLDLDLYTFDAESFLDKQVQNKQELIDYDKNRSFGLYATGIELFDDLVNNRVFSPSPCLYVTKREVLIQNKILFVESIVHEDELFTVEVFLNSARSMHENKFFFKRRIRPGSTMTKQLTEKNFEGYYTVFNSLHKYLDNESQGIRRRLAIIFNSLINIYQSLDATSKNNLYIQYENAEKKAKHNKYYTYSNWLRHYNVFTNSIYKILLSIRGKIQR